MPVSLEKKLSTSPYEYSGESLATPEIQSDVDTISRIEQEIEIGLGLDQGSSEVAEKADEFLIDNAERPGATSEDMELAVIASALEATQYRPLVEGDPLTVLELEGYGAQITDVVRELHETHAMLPSGHFAADIVAQEINRVSTEHGLNGDVELTKTTAGESGIPEFDRLDDYSPEFAEQTLFHRSNAELNPGDIVLPSNQISPEMHKELNGSRNFFSTSSPRSAGSGEHEFYDAKLAHAGTRDFGESYGKYLYIVEPLKGDVLKWGENFGASVHRKTRVKSPALEVSGGGMPATTDTHTGKWHNEVVSTRGFRVVKKIAHEPAYNEALLPWPISPNALTKRRSRAEIAKSNVVQTRGSDTEPGSAIPLTVHTSARMRPGKIGPVNTPGTYRAGAEQRNPAEWRTLYDVQKQQAENPGQSALPGMPISKYGDPDRWKPANMSYPYVSARLENDDPLPGLEGDMSSRPML